MQVGRKDAGILKDGTVLDNGLLRLGNLNHLLETLVQEVYLQIKRPTGHVGIEDCQLAIVIYGFEPWRPAITMG